MFLPFTRYCFLLLIILPVSGLRLKVRGQVFNKRGHISGIDNGQNSRYFTNITLGTKQYSADIDTGR